MAAFARFGMADQMVALSCISSTFASQNSALEKKKAAFVMRACTLQVQFAKKWN